MNKCMILFSADKFVNQAQMICGGTWNEGGSTRQCLFWSLRLHEVGCACMLAYFGTEGFMKFGFLTLVHNAKPLGNLVIG